MEVEEDDGVPLVIETKGEGATYKVWVPPVIQTEGEGATYKVYVPPVIEIEGEGAKYKVEVCMSFHVLKTSK